MTTVGISQNGLIHTCLAPSQFLRSGTEIQGDLGDREPLTSLGKEGAYIHCCSFGREGAYEYSLWEEGAYKYSLWGEGAYNYSLWGEGAYNYSLGREGAYNYSLGREGAYD